MSRIVRSTLALVAVLALGTPLAAAEKKEVTSDEVVNALEGAYGVQPGQRRNHTKGTCALGTFVGMPEATKYSRSALFSGNTVPVVARFSLAGGDPKASDAERSPRGMALEFRLPNGALQHMTMIDTPMFFAAMPRTFLDKMLALRPDPVTGKPDPKALEAFAASHPDARGQARFLSEHNPSPSYATITYYGIHTFKFIDRNNRVTLVRWRFVPQDGEKALTDAELAADDLNVGVAVTKVPGKADKGTEIQFEGVPTAFTKEPFMLTFTVQSKDKIEGWPAQAAGSGLGARRDSRSDRRRWRADPEAAARDGPDAELDRVRRSEITRSPDPF